MKFFLLLIFTCEILSAKEIITLGNAKKVVQTPENCVETGTACAFKTASDEKFKFMMHENQIVLDENTAVMQMAGTDLVLVSGQIWLHAKSEIKIETPYGSTRVYDGDFLIRNRDKKMQVLSIAGAAILKPRGGNELRLEAGEQNWIGEVDETKTASSGVPVPIRPSELVVNWARLYTGTKVEFESEFKKFFEVWSVASEDLAKFHSGLAARRVATVDVKAAQLKKIKEEREKERKKMRDWFRSRSLAD